MAKKLSLETLCKGGFEERMNRVLSEIAQNILDPNTDAEKARKLTCTITFKPNGSRDMVSADVVVKPTLVPAAGLKTAFVVGQDIQTGKVEMTEYNNQIRGQVEFDTAGRRVDTATGEVLDAEPAAPRNIRDLRRA